MRIAEETAKLSRARRLQVGCVIVKDDNIISFGWNGTPAGWDNDCEYREYCPNHETNYEYPFEDVNGRYRLVTKSEVIHAEANAILKLTRSHNSSKNSSMFLTHAPCIECAKLISNSGIHNIFYREVYRNKDGINFLIQSKTNVSQI